MIYVAGGFLLLILIAFLIHRPIATCAVCEGAMFRTAPGKVICLDCGREGNV